MFWAIGGSGGSGKLELGEACEGGIGAAGEVLEKGFGA